MINKNLIMINYHYIEHYLIINNNNNFNGIHNNKYNIIKKLINIIKNFLKKELHIKLYHKCNN